YGKPWSVVVGADYISARTDFRFDESLSYRRFRIATPRYLLDYTPSNSFLQGRGKCAKIRCNIETAMTESSTTGTQPKRGRGWWNRLLWVCGLPSRAAA